jgi:hypothetical protein
MTALEWLIAHYRNRQAQILENIRTSRAMKSGLHHNNNVDMTEAWLQEQQRRADELGNIIAAYA